MAEEALLKKAKSDMGKAQDALRRDLADIRAGRANAGLLNRVMVNYYGAPTPLNQVAAINVPEPRVLTIKPYDKSALGDIEKAILTSDLGLNPANDGNVIRLVIPQLTGERRQELAKEVGKDAENAKIAVRNVRRDAMEELKKAAKAGDISEDEQHDLEDKVQKITDDAVKGIDQIAKDKESEITEV
ncbi:ribosome recycling factor [Schleiferilactobacillus shenzhenensis]|uniref:Ribosome-recycling factor n=1 Tax=Schleiferilactobacillus shenzhenensis LY-73 TaxID=1231336 RepID=U4TRG5_9LACO|nr:ribosome recycling factor [Schleiferilactobacillus shenzhenensis]ERL64488.1 Frr [Schleiferilactobacillus shenzhenensis LY-73]